MNPVEYLAKLQAEAGKHGFHKDLRAWVDDNSGVARVLRAMEPVSAPPRRPSLVTYRGIRVDTDPWLWMLYENVCNGDVAPDRAEQSLKLLYQMAGAGGWDDICRDCPQNRYEHRNADHPFISEEQ